MASLRGGVRDFAGNTVTGPLPDVTAFQVGYLPGPSPLVTGTSPRADATGVPVNSIVQIQSNANLAQFAGITATLAENGKPLNASMRMEGDGRTLTLVPSRPFAASALLEVVVTGITSDPYHFSFTTGSDPVVDAPRAEVWPINGQSAVPASVVVHIRFDQRLNPLSVNASNVTLQLAVLDGPLMDATVSLDGSQSVISLAPKLPLLAGRSYTVSWAVSALGGGTARNTSSFTVGPWDDAPAALLGIDPASGSSDASPRAVVRALFSKPVELTLGNAGFRLLLDGVAVPGQINVATGTSVLFTPLRPLQLGATYRVELSGVVDALGNALAPAVSTFTVALSDTAATALRLLSSSPVSGATGVAWDAPVRLSFNRPVTLSSALNLTVQSGLTRIPVAPRVEGNDIVFQFTAPVAGPQIVIRGVVSDTGDYATSVTLIYSLAPVADTTLPAVEYTFPAAGSTIPAFGSTMVIRFSEPVTVGQSAIRIIGASSSPEWYLAADGRTVTASPSLVPDSDIAVVVGSGVTDLTGNPLAPTSFSLHVLSADESASPRLKSVLPPAGAIGIPPDSLVQLQFTHPMDAATVNLGLHVIADGVPLTGSVAAPEDGRSFRFQPDSPFRRGALVDIRIGSPAQDTAGQLLEAFSSYFTVVKDGSAVNPSAITLSASTTAIDVGFDAPLDRISLSPCIRAGSECIPSHWELRDLAWLRVTPEVPLQPGRQYSLVLDQHTVFPLRLTTTLEEPEMESVEFEPGVVHIRFTGEINPLTINPGTLRLVGDRGAAVSYFAGIGAGRRDVLLRLQHPEPELTVVIDGPESASGVQIRRQQRRLRARPMEGSYPYR